MYSDSWAVTDIMQFQPVHYALKPQKAQCNILLK